jgi:predicted nucleotidyltransferase
MAFRGASILRMLEEQIESVRRALAAFPAVRLAVLFGSAARGQDAAARDLDLGVLLEEAGGASLWEIEKAVAATLRRPFDLVDLHRAPPLLRFQIARDGRLLVEREEGDWKRFKVRALLDWWDWAPTARQLHRIAAQRLRESVHGPA